MADYPLGRRGAIIGGPYQGTHAKAFNVKGGSDNWQSENAVDIAVPVGTPVYAVASGTVSPPGYGFGPGGKGRFAGDRLHLVTAGNAFYYAHLSQIVVKPGERVQAGQLLGYSGEANGVAHLHFAAQKGDPVTEIRGGNIPAAAPQQTQPSAAPTTQATTPAAETQPQPVAGPPAQTPIGVEPLPGTPPLPGSQNYMLPAQNQTESWQTVAQLGNLSPDTQRYITLAGG